VALFSPLRSLSLQEPGAMRHRRNHSYLCDRDDQVMPSRPLCRRALNEGGRIGGRLIRRSRGTAARLISRRAHAHRRAERWESAARAYRAALACDDSHAWWHFWLGQVYRHSGRFASAAAAYKQAVKRDDSRPEWFFRLGRAYEQAGNLRRAGKAYRAALRRMPETTERDYTLLADSKMRLPGRIRISRFVERHLDEIKGETMGMARPDGANHPFRIYFFWAQGIDNAPPVVRRCHHELLRHHTPDHVVTLDANSIEDLVHIDKNAYEKAPNWTKLSDILRLELLYRYGGIWVDATCLVRTHLLEVTPQLLEPSGFFAFRWGRNRLATWFLAAEPGNYLVAMWRAAQYAYWRHFDRSIDYKFVHHLFEALCHLDGEFKARWDETPKMRAKHSAAFRHVMHQTYEPDRFQQLLDSRFIHKLTYKYNSEQIRDDSFLSRLITEGVPLPEETGPPTCHVEHLR
jgi:tetratricopeptide (TPR) repeat protein